MDANNGAAETLPLPVKEIVRHMRKSLKTERPRPRRLSDIHPTHSQRHPAITTKSRCALTPTGLSSAHTFFPPSCTPVYSFKKQTVSKTMDVFVPSPGVSAHFATSPLSSIYDQERSDCGRFCGNSKFSNTSMDSLVSDDNCGLDDNMEDGSLQTLLTPDVMNTLHQTPFNTAELSWIGKQEHDVPLSKAANDCLNPTLTQLNMQSDIPFVNDLMSIDQDDRKLMYSSNFGFFPNDMDDFSSRTDLNCVSVSSPAPNCVQASTKAGSQLDTVSIPNNFHLKNSADIDNTFIPSMATLKNHFRPRASKPQIGVAAVIQPKLEKSQFPKMENVGQGELKLQSPILHKLVSTSSHNNRFKSEVPSPTEGHNKSSSELTDISAQIVPSSGATKRTHAGLVKSEPESPKSVIKENSTEEKWQAIKSFMHSPESEPSLKKRILWGYGSLEHISDDDVDNDEESSSYGDKDYDDSDDDYSDIDADLAHIKPSECESLVALGKKQKQFFWQYNVQSKGPKGTRLKLAVESPSDPHVLNNFEDPVFDVCNTTIAGIRHGGKARKGDGNEITPNPKKLFMIGHQLMRLNHQINDCQMGTDVPLARRNESRKEKNKLASRACRLKKKAQHEANKIKLYGLEQEHSQLNSVLLFIWPYIREKAKAVMGQSDKLSSPSTLLTGRLESQIDQNLNSMIAGHTVEYVNSVILKVESGDYSGGLNIKRSHKT